MKDPPSSLPDEILSDLIAQSSSVISKTAFATDEVSDRVRRFLEVYQAIPNKPEGAALLFRDPVPANFPSYSLGDEVVVGRMPKKSDRAMGCDLAIEDDKMSREHFKITLADNCYVLKDL